MTGRRVEVTVVGAVAFLLVLLVGIVLTGVKQNEFAILSAIGIHAVPPPDRSRAFERLSGNPGSAFSADDYPAEAIRSNAQGRAVAKLTIGPDGEVDICRITLSSGNASLDKATCDVALREIVFTPARDGAGRATTASFDLPVRWVLPPE